MTNKPEYLIHRLVMEMDRKADELLMQHFNMSYKRGHYLAVLQDGGTMTQHKLAVILGHSDPAVSKMLLELSKEGLVSIKIDPKHARKRLVSLTKKGDELTKKGNKILSEHFNSVMTNAKVNPAKYAALTKKIFDSLMKS